MNKLLVSYMGWWVVWIWMVVIGLLVVLLFVDRRFFLVWQFFYLSSQYWIINFIVVLLWEFSGNKLCSVSVWKFWKKQFGRTFISGFFVSFCHAGFFSELFLRCNELKNQFNRLNFSCTFWKCTRLSRIVLEQYPWTF